jgi:cytochrome c5
MTRFVFSAGAIVVAGAAFGACAPASPPTQPAGPEPPIAAVHRSKCGACHKLPAPGTRTRAHLEDAFARHRKRVRLSEDEWAALVDFLARPE